MHPYKVIHACERGLKVHYAPGVSEHYTLAVSASMFLNNRLLLRTVENTPAHVPASLYPQAKPSSFRHSDNTLTLNKIFTETPL